MTYTEKEQDTIRVLLFSLCVCINFHADNLACRGDDEQHGAAVLAMNFIGEVLADIKLDFTQAKAVGIREDVFDFKRVIGY